MTEICFSGNNKSDIVASGSGESHRLASSRANKANNRQFPQVHERSSSTEHVKLEEAHISAPSRAKLDTNSSTGKKPVNSAIVNRRKKVEKPKRKAKKNSKTQTAKKVTKQLKGNSDIKESKIELRTFNLSTEVVNRPVMEVTLDDTDEPESESQGESSKETEREVVKDEEKLINSSTEEPTLVSEDLQSFYTTVKSTLDFIISERKHTSIELADFARVDLISKGSSSEQLQVAKESNIIELHTEVSVSDDKADVENQDLLSGNDKRLTNDEGIVPVYENIITSDKTSGSTLEIKETVVVNSLSEENIKVLEQYEAIMEVSEGTTS